MSYNLLNPVVIINAVSMGASITSSPVEIKMQDNVGVQLHWTGTPNGTFAFQVSMDYRQDQEGNVVVAGNWITLPVSPGISAVGAADDAYVDLNQVSAPYMRIVYTRASSTGTLTAYVNGKGI